MVCLVLDWRNAVDWIQRHLTKANVGPKKDNRDGRQQIVFQKYCRQLVLKYKILQSSSIIQTILDVNNKLRFLDTMTAMNWFLIAVFFLLDNRGRIIYPECMLNGLHIFSSDPIWRQILADLNADIVDNPKISDVDFDSLNLVLPINPVNLRVAIMDAMDNTNIINRVLGENVHLSRLPSQIITILYKTGGMSSTDLKIALGYAADTNTHTVDTAICALRKTYGRDFIQNDNGVYKLGRI